MIRNLIMHFSLERCNRMMKIIDKIALVLVIIGALNWGGVGIFAFDTVAWICGGAASVAARIIYTLVGLAGLWSISLLFREDYSRELNED